MNLDNQVCIKQLGEFFCGTHRLRIQHCHLATWVNAMAQVQFLALEIPHAMGAAKKKKKEKPGFKGRREITKTDLRIIQTEGPEIVSKEQKHIEK